MFELTWNENDRKAGMGIRAAMKNANMLLKDVRKTLTPVLARQYATGSWNWESFVVLLFGIQNFHLTDI